MLKVKPKKIKSVIANRIYDFKMIAKVFSVHIRTVQAWHKKGMPVIDEDSRPYLVEGSKLKKFLYQQVSKGKVKLADDEFYCFKCRTKCHSKEGSIVKINTNEKIGKNLKKVIFKGCCEFCGLKVSRFSTDKEKLFLKNTECEKGLFGTNEQYLNTDLEILSKNSRKESVL